MGRRLTQFNVSVLVSDALMRAVRDDATWDLGFHVPRADGVHVDVYPRELPHNLVEYEEDLSTSRIVARKGDIFPWYVYRRLPARQFWEDLMRSTYVHAEPGVIFIDRVNAQNNLNYVEDIRCTNPCGEQPLPPNAICCLGSVNVAMMVDDPFTDNAALNLTIFEQATWCGIRMLDNVLDVSNYPLREQREEARSKRRIGLGVTGVGDALAMLGVRYGSEESIQVCDLIARNLQLHSYEASADLAKERGPCAVWDADLFNRHNLDAIGESGARPIDLPHGLRNGVLNTVAPNGTISLYLGNVSSGIEPVFSYQPTTRRVRQSDGTARDYASIPLSHRLYNTIHGETDWRDLPDYFVGAMDVDPRDHVRVQAAFQGHIDSSISKTVNCPTELSYEDFAGLYAFAYELGCKGCTTYRPDPESGRGSVLSVDETTVKIADVVDVKQNVQPVMLPRAAILDGRTHKLKWRPGTSDESNWYVTVTNDGADVQEVFVNARDQRQQEFITALMMLSTAVLRRGDGAEFLVSELRSVYSGTGGGLVQINGRSKYCPSIVAAIGEVVAVERERLSTGDLPGGTTRVRSDPLLVGAVEISGITETGNADICPRCREPHLVHEGGCRRCLACGHEECG